MINRLFSFALIVITTVFGYVLYKQQDVGHINISLGSVSIETSLLVFGAFGIAFLFGIIILLRIIERFRKGLSELTLLIKEYFVGKAQYALSDSLIDIAAGDYEKAEKRLLVEIKNSADPFPLYLAAAKAAQEQHADGRRDEYLTLAQGTTRKITWAGKSKTEIAIGLIKAEFYLSDNKPELAISVLATLEKTSPKHTRVLTLLSDAYLRLSRWQQLHELIAMLYKHKVLPDDEIQALEIETWRGLINDNTTPEKADFLCTLWGEAPAHVKTSNELLELCIDALKNAKRDDEAAQILELNLNHNWQDSLVVLYAQLDTSANDKQLETIEGWLKEHPDNACLLLILGKMCAKQGLWGKAISYLEASLAIKPMPETCLRLATLFEEHMNDPESAQNYYRKGLRMRVDNTLPTTIKKNILQIETQPLLKIVSPK